MYTQLCIKQNTDENLLLSTGSTVMLCIDLNGKEIHKRGVQVYLRLIHFAVPQKLVQRCKATVLFKLKNVPRGEELTSQHNLARVELAPPGPGKLSGDRSPSQHLTVISLRSQTKAPSQAPKLWTCRNYTKHLKSLSVEWLITQLQKNKGIETVNSGKKIYSCNHQICIESQAL